MTLLTLARGEAAKAQPALEELAKRLPQGKELAGRPETLLVMAAGLEAATVRDVSREILAHVFEAAIARKDAAAQAMIRELISPENRTWLEAKSLSSGSAPARSND